MWSLLSTGRNFNCIFNATTFCLAYMLNTVITLDVHNEELPDGSLKESALFAQTEEAIIT